MRHDGGHHGAHEQSHLQWAGGRVDPEQHDRRYSSTIMKTSGISASSRDGSRIAFSLTDSEELIYHTPFNHESCTLYPMLTLLRFHITYFGHFPLADTSPDCLHHPGQDDRPHQDRKGLRGSQQGVPAEQ